MVPLGLVCSRINDLRDRGGGTAGALNILKVAALVCAPCSQEGQVAVRCSSHFGVI